MIREIAIRNFRSITNIVLEANRVTTLVGANDAGKSNVLRALNLFFNGETNPNEPFDFSKDFNNFAPRRAKKAPEIEIEISLELPASYQRADKPSRVRWKKVWRKDGEARTSEKRTYTNGLAFEPRSKVPTLLDRIRYIYVPAIKDKAFFADLQGRLYDVLAFVAEQPLKTSASAFQKQLGEQLEGLLTSLTTTFGTEATMQLPENLRAIFESLEINSGGIPLSRRGDGIKIRHIPKFLRFIAERQHELYTRGGVPYTHIWGFEEPENNVEMSAAFDMANDFVDLITTERFQLFITTHSPVFYRLDWHTSEARDWNRTHFVCKSADETVVTTRAPHEVDETMGLMPLVAPYVAEAKKRYDTVHAQLKDAQAIIKQGRPTIFVEGESDRKVLMKAWQLFSGRSQDEVYFCAGDTAYGGAPAVKDRALAWLLTMRHRPESQRVPSVVLFDNDPAGQDGRHALTQEMQRFKLRSHRPHVMVLDIPERLRHLLSDFNIPVVLESYFSDSMWERAEKAGWLEECPDISQVVKPDALNKILRNSGPNPLAAIDPCDRRRLTRHFNANGKKKAARAICQLTGTALERELEPFRPLIEKLCRHLFPATQTVAAR